jgi:hypothetical protein
MKARSDRFALLLRAYPKAYRDRRGEEILAILLEDAPTFDTYESVRVGIDIVAHGLRLRVGIASDQLAGRVLVVAALPGMMMAAAAAMVMPLFGQVLPDIRYGPSSWGPDTAIWPGLCIAWIVGCVAALVFPKRGRLLAAACVAATVIAKFLLPIGPWGLPPGFLLLISLAVPSLLAPRTSPRRSRRGFAVLVGAVVLGALVVASVRSPWVTSGGPEFHGEFSRCTPYVAGTVIACSAILLAAHKWMYGSALALLAIPWLLFPMAEPGPLTVSTTTSALSVAAACAISVGLLGLWFSDLWKVHESIDQVPIDQNIVGIAETPSDE